MAEEKRQFPTEVVDLPSKENFTQKIHHWQVEQLS